MHAGLLESKMNYLNLSTIGILTESPENEELLVDTKISMILEADYVHFTVCSFGFQ